MGSSPTTIDDFPATVIFNVNGAQQCAGTPGAGGSTYDRPSLFCAGFVGPGSRIG
ncbi:hypothetical protein OHS18_09950 [Amycolatopsis sp. NBC_00355]|uniref:hypothetical protein n=1 Tax=Amycolatopsis sp. NBC_00355 TaxID=2975957 RepID=UPI002E26519E